MISVKKPWSLHLFPLGALLFGVTLQAVGDDRATVIRGHNQIAVCIIGCSEESASCDVTCQSGGNHGNPCTSDADCQVCTGSTAIDIAWYDEHNNLLKQETFDPVPNRGVRGLYFGAQDGSETVLRCEGMGATEGDVATAVLDARGPGRGIQRGPQNARSNERGCSPEHRPESPCWRVTALANDG